MKQFLSVILAVVLVAAVGGSAVSGTVAGFFDTEVSAENYMCAGTVNLELSGGLLNVTAATPSEWYSEEHVLINTGTLDATASVHLKNLVEAEDAPGVGVATSEPELVAEEGGWLGQQWIDGLGTDIANIADFIDVKLWYDSDDDGVFELVAEGKLRDLICIEYILGVIPGNPKVNNIQGGGWGSYFEYTIGASELKVPLMMGQNTGVGTVSVSTDNGYLKVNYDTTASGWEMAETAVYVGNDPPEKMAPGRFPYKHEGLGGVTEDLYQIPLAWNGTVYIAAHAAGTDNETGWAKGVVRKFMIEVHFPDIPEGDLGYNYFDETDPEVQEKCWDHWPTNAYQGDKATFDTEFYLEGLSGSSKHKGKGG